MMHAATNSNSSVVATGFLPAAYAAPAHNLHQDYQQQQTLQKSTRTGKILIDPALDAKYRAMKPPCTRCYIDKYTRFRYFNNKNALLTKGKEPQARFACKSPKCLAAFPEKSEVEFTYDGKVRQPYASKNKKRTAAHTLTSTVIGNAASTSASHDSIKRPRKSASSSLSSKQHVDSYAPHAYARNVHLYNSNANICIPAVQQMMLAANNVNVALGIPAPPHMVMVNNVSVAHALGIPAPPHMVMADNVNVAHALGVSAPQHMTAAMLPDNNAEQNFHANDARVDDEFTLAELLGGTYTDHDQEEAAAIVKEDPPTDRLLELMEEMTQLLQDYQHQQLSPATISSASPPSAPTTGAAAAADDVHFDELEGDDLMRWLMPV